MSIRRPVHRTLVISGSLRAASVTTLIARTALAQAGPGHELVLAAGLDGLPLFNEDLDTDRPPPQVAALRAQVGSADSLFVLTPVYNAGISAALKNAIDWLSRPRDHCALAGKPVAGLVVGYHSQGAEHQLTTVLRAAGATALNVPLPMLGLRTIDQRDVTGDPRVRRTVQETLAVLRQAPDPVPGPPRSRSS
ncbi:NAD(P)H-dependent oxidoreductase [Streptomyces sp. NPDC008092]|uniref:NADPH-dependent FMN reductase n=1 Tax=Streptomyces sp. NPDC008092 TaxID=3364808 RepID=UPI0036E5FC87